MKTRKDALPENTINRIKDILDVIGINVIEKEKICHKNYWYSVRIEIDGLDGVGVNGKGFSEEYARASAYGELMERLQSGTLIENLYSEFHQENENEYYNTQEELCLGLKHIHSNIDIGNYHVARKRVYKKATYINYIENKKVDLPEWFLDMNCMTNGLCAGNTFHEAAVQGIFEIFERNARKKIYADEMKVFRISEEELKGLDSYEVLCEVKRMGYGWDVIDCTDGGVYPVLGLVLWDKVKENYLFVMGADLDLDICLQRCVTETFQGRKVDFRFHKYMENMFDIYQEKNIEDNEEYQNSVLSNAGKVPYKVLFCQNETTRQWKNAFAEEVNSNEQIFNVLVTRIKSLGYLLYIKDMSYYGFPTYRVYIPGISEVIEAARFYLKYNEEVEKFTEGIGKLRENDKGKTSALLKQVKDLLKIPFNGNISMLKRMKGIVLNGKEYVLDNHYLLTVLYSMLGDRMNAIAELKRLSEKYPYLKKTFFLYYVVQIADMDQELKGIITSVLAQ